MTDTIPWFKSIQSVGRGFRPGMEIQVLTGGADSGKSIVFDIESDEFKPWRLTFLTYYVEYRDYDTGETYWKRIGIALFERLVRFNYTRHKTTSPIQ